MYMLSRLILILGVLLVGYCAAVVIILTAPVSLAGIVVVMLAMVAKKKSQLTAYGTARWSDERELRDAGMWDSGRGLVLGRMLSTSKRSLRKAVGQLFNPLVTSAIACAEFLEPGRRTGKMKTGELVWLSGAVHTSVFAPTGAGKGVSLVIPFLQTCPDSCVVVDFKGDLAKITSLHRRRRFGHRVVILDPFRVVTPNPDTLNVLDFIDKDSPTAIDDCRDLAQALVIRTGQEKDPHWCDGGEMFIGGIAATVVQYGQKGARSMQEVRDLVSDPTKMKMAIELMQKSDAWGGILARLGHQLTHFRGDELGSTLTTTNRFLRHFDSPAIVENTKASTFNLLDLPKGKLTLYLVLPPEHMRAQSPLLRMWIGACLRAVVQGGLQERRKTHFILDEMASVGHLEQIDDALDKLRAYGVRCQFYFQSLGQLKKCFPEGQDQTLLSNTTQAFFAVNDQQTADYVSARLGEATIVVDSGGSSRGGSWQASQGAQHSVSSGSSWNNNQNWQQLARKLLKPEEVMALPARTAITFTPGVPPICTTLVRYYEERLYGLGRGWLRGFWKASTILVHSLVVLAMAIGLAGWVTEQFGPRARQIVQQIAIQVQRQDFRRFR